MIHHCRGDRNKIAHRTRLGAYRHLVGTYWRYWRNSGFKALPDFGSRSVYECRVRSIQLDLPGRKHYHIGRNKVAK